MNCTIRVAKTKALIKCAVTAQSQLICVFIFAYAKIQFSREAAPLKGFLLLFYIKDWANSFGEHSGLVVESKTRKGVVLGLLPNSAM